MHLFTYHDMSRGWHIERGVKVGAGSERVARGRARENEVGHYATHAHRGVGISRLVYDRRNGDDKWGINVKNVAKCVPTARPSLHSHAPQCAQILTSHVLSCGNTRFPAHTKVLPVLLAKEKSVRCAWCGGMCQKAEIARARPH